MADWACKSSSFFFFKNRGLKCLCCQLRDTTLETLVGKLRPVCLFYKFSLDYKGKLTLSERKSEKRFIKKSNTSKHVSKTLLPPLRVALNNEPLQPPPPPPPPPPPLSLSLSNTRTLYYSHFTKKRANL